MAVTFEPVTPDFAAVGSGVDLRAALNPEDKGRIIRASDKYAVLVFHGQFLAKEDLIAFGGQFGELDTGLQTKIMHKTQNRIGHAAVSDISNLDATGKVADRHHWQTLMNVSNRFWHSDGSFKHYPNRYSILNAIVAVARGGETEFADLRAAYDALDENTKELINDKIGTFYSHNTRDWLQVDASAEERSAYPPVQWPLVRTHPGSKRKVLWCDSKVARISGMSVPEGRALAHELIEHIGQRERVYRHRWASGDLVMYDNRSALHRGRRFNLDERREMRRVEVVDAVHSLGEVAHAALQTRPDDQTDK
jgi:alpha-ketoglutarate-dependent 2,4-dichlorophenoxyacetate dioxygenase